MQAINLSESYNMSRWQLIHKVLNAAFVGAIGFALASLPLDYIDAAEGLAEKAISAEIAKENILTLTGDDVESVSAEQFIRKYRDRALNVVDLRTEEKYSEGHIVGAVNISEDRMDRHALTIFDKNAEVYIFCNYNPSCEIGDAGHGVLSRCKRVAQKFKFHHGYRNAILVRANLRDLTAAGVAVTGRQQAILAAKSSHKIVQP
ncbi:rhodanese-like domain-containing protein [Lysobacter sp. 1R34A]|uniref:rhodanese-like domain-containing protein n=1 Tax=Lysobacter sp. 1R34A TaxID=3445786 RepID=UPI003EEAD74E